MISERDSIYALLEDKFITYRALKTVPVRENGEALVDLEKSGIATNIYDEVIAASTGRFIMVRAGVVPRLKKAQAFLQAIRADLRLQVFYGYRDPVIQTQSFARVREQLGLSGDLNDHQREIIHRSIAVPDVAGHPTGGAVDITIIDENDQPLDMGTVPHAFEKDSYTFSPFIDRNAWANRQLLRSAMLSAQFAPYDGEWWHFSYGDREWARYWEQDEACYASCQL